VTATPADSLDHLVGAVPRTGDEPMTPCELRMVRHTLGLDQDHLARLLGVTERTVRRWEAGSHVIPDGAREDMEDLERVAGGAVGRLVDTLGDMPDDPLLRVPRGTGEWAGVGWPPGWWLAVASRVAQEVPGLTVEWDD
jgi:transcriptional regulator with XRE-family HTH domain